MRVGLDATPLLGTRTGIGRYTAALLDALRDGPDDLVATAFTLRGRGALGDVVPRGVAVAARPAPARALQELWARAEWPPVELLAGRVDVFHATNFVLPPLRRARGVVTVHDLAYLRLTETVSTASARYRDLVPRSLRRAGAVITPSEAVAEQVREAYSPTVPVVAVPHGVADAWRTAQSVDAPLRRALGLPSAYLLFVGTLEPRKALATLLAAVRQLPDAPPLVLVGPPGWGAELDVSGCVTTGYLDEDVLRPVVAGASALVLPSRDEGFGLPVLEALAAGTPVVASDLPVLREVGGDVVRYADVGDAESFAAAITAALADPGEAQARRDHAAPFTWALSAERTRAVYEQVLS
ncbi:MAG: glycosyltransferase family 1 protein [Mycobacteriales bacterium]|nr:glycosyltransferase family 1 protein [Mycobacteriales bacterium]